MKIVVTAGPTREYIDDVRFISNPSSGRMGYAVAEAAAQAGHETALISGPVEIPPPPGVRLVKVNSAIEMRDAVQKEFEDCDCLVMAAAVGDYRPVRRVAGKIKKTSDTLLLELVRTPDILAEIGRKKGARLLIGFALEAADGERNALAKLRSKNLDYVILNSPAAFGAEAADAVLLGRDGSRSPLPGASKSDIARKILEIVKAQAEKR